MPLSSTTLKISPVSHGKDVVAEILRSLSRVVPADGTMASGCVAGRKILSPPCPVAVRNSNETVRLNLQHKARARRDKAREAANSDGALLAASEKGRIDWMWSN